MIDEIVREGARRMLAEALRAEVDAYIAAFAAARGQDGRRLVVRNGYLQPREVLTSAGAVEVTAPRLCLLVMIGVRADGRKELVALADGYGESAGPREVFPETREGRCWFHKTANVLAVLPKSARLGAKKALAEIWGAVNAFKAAYGTTFPKAVAKITQGPGSRAARLAMAFKLIESAQARWRCVNAPHLVALVRAEAVFRDGVLAERPEQAAA
jgi:hypothetical protein